MSKRTVAKRGGPRLMGGHARRCGGGGREAKKRFDDQHLAREGGDRGKSVLVLSSSRVQLFFIVDTAVQLA